MGIVVDPDIAFKVCHGYKVDDDELILWSPGVVGALSDEQEKKCETIVLNNVEGNDVFHSVEEALKAPIKREEWEGLRKDHFRAMKFCSKLLHEAEMHDMIIYPEDVYGFMDYCMAKLGFGAEKVRPVREKLKKFIDMRIEEYED